MRAYLAGPEVFLPNAKEVASQKVAICRRYQIDGLAPLNEDVASLDAMPQATAAQVIFDKDEAMMLECDIIIANLTPFRGVSADAGTIFELGWFRGRGRQAFAYSNSSRSFDERSREYLRAFPDPVSGTSLEGFGQADNLMIPFGVRASGGYPILTPEMERGDFPFGSLDLFERAVALAAYRLRLMPKPDWLP